MTYVSYHKNTTHPPSYAQYIHPRPLIHLVLDFLLLTSTCARESLLVLRVDAHLAVRAGRVTLGEIRRVDGHDGVDDLRRRSVYVTEHISCETDFGKVFETGRQDQDVWGNVEFQQLVMAEIKVNVGCYVRGRRDNWIHSVRQDH
jgi:hypothetical protein